VHADNTHEWCAQGIEPQINELQNISLKKELPWFAKRILNREVLHLPDINLLPKDAHFELKHFEDQNIKSLIVVPMVASDRNVGFLGFDSVREKRVWTEDDQNLLKLTGETITNALNRQSAERNINEMAERLNLATRAARLGIWDWDIIKNELIWNDEMYVLYGIEKKDSPNAYETWLNSLHPDDRTEKNSLIDQARRGEQEFDTEFRVVWPGGAIRHIKAFGQVMWNSDGDPIRMTGINYDITEKKNVVGVSMLKTPEREKVIEYSVPHSLNFTYVIMIEKDRVKEFEPYLAADRSVLLEKLITESSLKLNLSLGRSYSAFIDGILKKYSTHSNITYRGSSDGLLEGILKKMLAKRADQDPRDSLDGVGRGEQAGAEPLVETLQA